MLSTIEQALFILAVPYSVAGTIFKFVLIEPFDLLRKSGTTISIFWLFGQWLPSLHNSQRLNRYNYSGSNRTAWLYARIIEAYVYSSFEQYTVPFYRYNHSITMQLFYTTNMCEIGTVYPGLVGRYGYRCEGIIGYVVSTERSSANINPIARLMMKYHSNYIVMNAIHSYAYKYVAFCFYFSSQFQKKKSRFKAFVSRDRQPLTSHLYESARNLSWLVGWTPHLFLFSSD
ncbi:unnamed protein product [Rotaria socialis]